MSETVDLVEEHALASDGLRLLLRRWPMPKGAGAAKASVLIVHGFGEHGGRYAHVARALGARGYDVWAVDLRGHGRSEGPRAYVTSFDEFVGDVAAAMAHVKKNAEGRKVFLVAHSLGGCISTLFVLKRHPDIAGLALSGPALALGEDFSPAKIKVGTLLGKLAPRLPIEKLSASSVSRDPEVVRAYENDPLVYRGWVRTGFGLAFIEAADEVARRGPELEVPLLILQGAEDKLVNKSGGKALYEKARSKDKRLEIFPALYHEVFNEPEKERVIGILGEWLDARA